MPSATKIDEKIINTLNEKREVYSRKGNDNPYTSKSKKSKQKYLASIQKTPYLYMLSIESIQEKRSDTAEIVKNMKANNNVSAEYTQEDRGYNEPDYEGGLIDISDKKKYYTKNYSTENRNYLNKDYWTSGPVLLSNTELSKKVGKKIKFGLDAYEARGDRPYRPNAGVKGLSSEYLSSGQQSFVRKITVNWTCFTLEDLDFLQDRFMTLGRKVFVEWGWAEDGKTKTPVFLKEEDGRYVSDPSVINDTQVFTKDSDGEELVIQDSAAKNLKKTVIDRGKGNFDAIIGFVEGFEFSQRDDGGFDCTTNLVVNGGNIFNIPKEKKKLAAEAKLTTKEQKQKRKNNFVDDINDLHKILDYYLTVTSATATKKNIYSDYVTAENVTTDVEESWRRDLRTTTAEGIQEQSSEYLYNNNAVIKKDIVKRFDNFTKSGRWSDNNTTSEGNLAAATKQLGKIEKKISKNFRGENLEDVVPAQCWVRWGWFEDNILNKHFALVNEKGEVIAAHRSVENGESMLCDSHEDFQTTDINNFVFPGKFNLSKITKETGSGTTTSGAYSGTGVDGTLLLYQSHQRYLKSRTEVGGGFTAGDDQTIQDLQQLLEDFELTPGNLNLQETGIVPYLELVQLSRVFSHIHTGGIIGTTTNARGKTAEAKALSNYNNLESITLKTDENSFIYPTDQTKGRIRNIFINVAKLQSIFSSPSNTVKENFNLISNALYNETNGLINIKLEIKDDGGTTLVDKSGKSDEEKLIKIIEDNGIYEFPVHTNDSFVESQELSSDISSKMTQIMISKQYASQAVKDEKGNLLAQAVFDGVSDNKIVEEIVAEEVVNEFTEAPVATATPAALALKGKLEFKDFGIADGDEKKNFIIGGKQKGAKTDGLPDMDYDPDVPWEMMDDNQVDAESASKYWEELELDYTITGQLKNDKKREMFENIDRKELEDNQIKIGDGKTYQISNVTEDKFGLLFITNTIEITGIAGIIPGNVWTTSYLPKKFKENAHFWTTNVSQNIDSSGWKTTITGRANIQFEKVESSGDL